MEDPATFCLAVVALLFAPGPTNVLLALSGATAGAFRSWPALLGALLGYMVTVLAIATAFEPLLASFPTVESVVRIVAGAYLGMLAVSLWRSPPEESPVTVSARRVLATTCLNPKAFVLGLVVIPIHSPALPLYLAAFSAITVVAGIVWISIGAAARAAENRFGRRAPRLASIAMAVFAGALLASPMFS